MFQILKLMLKLGIIDFSLKQCMHLDPHRWMKNVGGKFEEL